MNIIGLVIISVAFSFAITAALGRVVIPLLHKLKFGQSIITDFGPTWHAKKNGIPTMGGLMIAMGMALTVALVLIIGKITGVLALSSNELIKFLSCIFLALGFGFVGFMDDFIKVKAKRNLGLTEIQKTIPEVLVIAAFLACLSISSNTSMFIPGFGKVAFDSVGGQIFFFVFGAIVIYGAVNSVNFTDGIDGLCAGVTLPVATAFAIMAGMYKLTSISLLACALVGALGGYLIWNHFPAKVIMGDVGSNFIGGLIVAFAYAIDCPLILVPVGIIYLIEGMSDVIQILSVRLIHKKVFKMAPIHHHYEMSGWKERKIALVFSVLSLIGSAVGVWIYAVLIK